MFRFLGALDQGGFAFGSSNLGAYTGRRPRDLVPQRLGCSFFFFFCFLFGVGGISMVDIYIHI